MDVQHGRLIFRRAGLAITEWIESLKIVCPLRHVNLERDDRCKEQLTDLSLRGTVSKPLLQ